MMSDQDDPNRTTQELIEQLGADVDRCHGELIETIDAGERNEDGTVSADYEYHARQLIRAILAYIEGVTFSVKISAVDKCLRLGIEVSDHERFAAVEIDADVNDKGEVVERSAKIRFANNVRFAFRLLERAHGGTIKFDPSAEWWNDLRKTVKVRHRLMHPRYPADIDISSEEIISALRAKVGFVETLTTFSPSK
jgi:hypothetical protein